MIERDIHMKLLLVAMHIEASARAVPLGPAMLASVVKRAFPETVQVSLLDLYLHQTAEACAELILATEPDWVGFSLYVWNRGLGREIAQRLRQRKPTLLLFAGGSEVTADPVGVLGEGCLDLVLPGEGEDLIVEVLGRVLRGEAVAMIQAAIRPSSVPDLSTLPSPYLDGTLEPAAYSGLLWELSRGCPFRCDFCFESRGTTGIRRVPMDRVLAELRLFEACGVSQVFVLDPTFNFDKNQAKVILRLIAAEAPASHFSFELRSEFIDAELASLFAAIHCSLQIGLQSADDAVLRGISRSIDRADFEAKVLLLHQAGASYGFDLIYGLPGDTLAGFQASLDFALSLAPNHLDLFPLSVLPGTRLHDTAPGLQLRHLPEIPYTVLDSPTFSAADMDAAARLAQACDRLYSQGKAVPWFALLREAVELPPSQLFLRFADHAEAHPDPDTTTLQVAFFNTCLADPMAAALAADIIRYFALSGTLLEGRAESTKDPLLWLRTQTQMATFQHDPGHLLEHLEAGVTELAALAFLVPANPCRFLLYLEGEGVHCQELSTEEATALEGLLGGLCPDSEQENARRFLDTVLIP